MDRYSKFPESLEESAKERFINFSKNYWVPEPSVHRVSEWLEDIKNLENIDDNNFVEYSRCFSFITKGKSKYIDCFYLLRQAHNNRIEIPKNKENGKWEKSYRIFVNSIAKIICKKDGLDLEVAKTIIDKNFKNYILPKHEVLKIAHGKQGLFKKFYLKKFILQKC